MEDETNSLYHKLLLTLFTVASLTILIAGSTYGEVRALAASAATCQTSGCARSTFFGTGLLILVSPILVCLYLGLQYALLQAGFHHIKHSIRPRGLLFLTLFPFLGTSLLFPYFTHLIYEPGYQTEFRFLAYTLLKAGMLFINTILLPGLLPICFRLNLLNTLKVCAIPLLLFGLLANSYFSDAKPHFNYFHEKRTYQRMNDYLQNFPTYAITQHK
ncbi:MAG: hypothetical protein K0Q50_2467 [Vampirovibrio sp.]|nr:hypothetical protein [Vampirovibrio sp.]